jgi:hypothetical protein
MVQNPFQPAARLPPTSRPKAVGTRGVRMVSPPWVTNLAIWEQYFSGEILSTRVAWAPPRPTRPPVAPPQKPHHIPRQRSPVRGAARHVPKQPAAPRHRSVAERPRRRSPRFDPAPSHLSPARPRGSAVGTSVPRTGPPKAKSDRPLQKQQSPDRNDRIRGLREGRLRDCQPGVGHHSVTTDCGMIPC